MLTLWLYSSFIQENKVVYKAIQSKTASPFQSTSTQVTYAPTDFIVASSKSTPAVVYIQAKKAIKSFRWMQDNYTIASGSGVIITSDGFIATNHHVIDDADEYMVQLDNELQYKATLVGQDPTTDLALLKIEADSLPFMQFGDSDQLQIGEWVLAVGNPFSLQSTVTAGIVSAKGRNINILRSQQFRIESFIQTDAAVNPGNSGGALVNTRGELVGINSAILSRTGNYEGYSFAIPANLAKKVLNDLRVYGNVQRGLLGVSILDVNQQIAQSLELPSLDGVYLTTVYPQTGAADAGLREGDVLQKINGITVEDVPKLQEQIGQFHPGDTIVVDYWRKGVLYNTIVILKNQINTTEIIAVRRDKILQDLGMEVRDLTEQEKNIITPSGVRVVSVYTRSKLDETGMVPSFIITHVNNQSVKNTDEMLKVITDTENEIVFKGFYEKHSGTKFQYEIMK